MLKRASKKRLTRPDYNALALALHKKLGGKLEVISKRRLKTKTDWSTMYTPGVGAVSSYVAKHPKSAREYTMKKNSVAVVSDGSAVLGLGNIGPLAALPVMEGKCAIFKEMAGIDGVPIVLATQDPDEIVETVRRIAPTFGAINLEDIKAPYCFEVEERLKKELDIPVMHDDQHGTAIVVLAGLINAAKVVEKNIKKMKVAIIGAGAAGRAIALLLVSYGVKDVVVVDSQGIISTKRKGLVSYKKELATLTNPQNVVGDATTAIAGRDVVVGVSGPGTLTQAHVASMAEKPIVFALANPVPEILPDEARRAGAYVVATGRSDFPNQVNNALVYPGIFRGALDRNVPAITEPMKRAAAEAVAALVMHPTRTEIIPKVTTRGLVAAVAKVIR
ncbi:NADP-dependent malic enzyme [Candidatus Kaiserbacteria bacterium]|nr:NADP-dependent malic enzyme [Candidatus Kaiserbacteria bacterium]